MNIIAAPEKTQTFSSFRRKKGQQNFPSLLLSWLKIPLLRQRSTGLLLRRARQRPKAVCSELDFFYGFLNNALEKTATQKAQVFTVLEQQYFNIMSISTPEENSRRLQWERKNETHVERAPNKTYDFLPRSQAFFHQWGQASSST